MSGELLLGRMSTKRYRCANCGHVHAIETNHWTECYPRCSWCGGAGANRMICLEPEGQYPLPEIIRDIVRYVSRYVAR